MQVILHIGSHKTGSTSFQLYCHHNRLQLMEDGIYWPGIFDYKNRPTVQHSILREALLDGEKKIVQDFIHESLEKAAETKCKKLLLSGEAFSAMTQSGVKEFISLFPKDCHFKVILYLRNIHGYVRSSMSQRLKNTQKLLNAPSHKFKYKTPLNYKKKITNWESVVPSNNIHVFSYDQHKKNLLQSLFDNIGHQSINKDYIENTKKSHANVSPDIGTLLHWSLAGLMPKRIDFEVMNSLYEAAHKGQTKVITPIECLFTKYMVDGLNLDFDHPKLLPLCPYLLAVPKPTNLTKKQQLDYMARQAKVFKRASSPIKILLYFWQRLKKFIKRRVRSLF